jgi:hypothetical protein
MRTLRQIYNVSLELSKTLTRRILLVVLGYMAIAFTWELWVYQNWLLTVWNTLSLAEQTQINLTLCLMDLKLILTILCILHYTITKKEAYVK